MSTTLSSVSKHFPKPQDGFTTTTSGSISSGATSVGLNSTGSYTNGDVVALIIDPTDASKKQAFTGTVDTGGSQITGVVWTTGTNQNHSAGATVVDYATATHIGMISKGALVAHDQDGTHKSGAVFTLPTITNFTNMNHTHATNAQGGQLSGSAIATGSQLADRLLNPYKFRTYRNAAANTGNGAFAVISHDTEDYDTGSNVAAGVFTAPISGFYQFNANATVTSSNVDCAVALFKNGAECSRGGQAQGGSTQVALPVSDLLKLVTGDTIDVRAYAASTKALAVGSSAQNFFSGYLVSAT